MLWGLIVLAFWVVSIITLVWILSKPKLRKKYSIFSILFASVTLGLVAGLLVFLAYVAIILFIIFVVFILVAALIGLFIKKK